MHYEYLDGKAVPPDIAAGVTFVPARFAPPNGAWATADGTQVTAVKDGADGFPLAQPEDPSKVGMSQGEFQKLVLDALARIEAKP